MKGPTTEQLRMQALVQQLKKEEMPLSDSDLTTLLPFVQLVREEIVENDAVLGNRGIRRIGYYMLNEVGLKLHMKWDHGFLDKHVRDEEKL